MESSHAQAEHQRSLSAWRQFVSHAPVPMALTLGVRHIVQVINPALARLFDLAPAAMLGRSLAEALPPDRAPHLWALLHRVFASGVPEAITTSAPMPQTYIVWPVCVGDNAAVGLAIQVQQLIAPLSNGAEETLAGQLRKVNERLLLSSLSEQEARDSAETALANLTYTQEALQNARNEFGAQVAERTHELAKQNQRLQATIAKLQQSEHARQELLRQLINAQEEERRRIARELHDQLGQEVTVLRVNLAALAASPPELAVERMARIQQYIAQLDTTVDRLALELRPMALDDVGLRSAVQDHIQQWSRHTGIAVEFVAVGANDVPVRPEIETAIYRIVQEALTNVLKHARARHVSVILEQYPHQIRVIVEDDGQGFDADTHAAAQAAGSIGLLGMHERVALLGGVLTIESEPGEGTTLFLLIPISSTLAQPWETPQSNEASGEIQS